MSRLKDCSILENRVESLIHSEKSTSGGLYQRTKRVKVALSTNLIVIQNFVIKYERRVSLTV